MQNSDIMILSFVVSILFIIFITSIIIEVTKNENPVGEENSIRARIIKKIGKIFDSY